MNRRIFYILPIIALCFSTGAYAGIGAVGQPSGTQDDKNKTEPGGTVTSPEFKGGIGKIGAPEFNKKKKSVADGKLDDYGLTPQMHRRAKIDYYYTYYRDTMPRRRSSVKVLWRAMPDPPDFFMKDYVKKLAEIEKKQAETAKTKGLPGLRGVPGLGGR